MSYAMLRVTGEYENDRASVTIQLDLGDDVGAAAVELKATCQVMLGTRVAIEEHPPMMRSVSARRGRVD